MPASYGDTITTILVYDQVGEPIETDCISLAPCQRVKICVEMDKDGYDSSASGNGLSGDYDTNFISGIVVTTDTQVANGTVLSDVDSEIVAFNLEENNRLCAEFEIPLDWQNTTQYLYFGFTFQGQDTNADSPADDEPATIQDTVIQDNVFFEVQLDVLELSDTFTLQGVITDGTYKHDRVCVDENTESLTLEIANDLEGDYCLIAFIKAEDEESYREHNLFENPNFPQITQPEFGSVPENISSCNGAFSLDMDVSSLRKKICYCIKLLALPCDPNEECACIDIIITQSIGSINTSAGVAGVQFQYQVISSSSCVQSIEITEAEAGVIISGSAASGITLFPKNIRPNNTINGEYQIEITLENGCTYSGSTNIVMQVAFFETQTVTLELCPSEEPPECEPYTVVIQTQGNDDGTCTLTVDCVGHSANCVGGEWRDFSTTPFTVIGFGNSVDVSVDGTYGVVALDNQGCESLEATVQVQVNK